MRALNRLVATVLAAAIAAACVVGLLEVVWAALGRGHAVVDWQPVARAAARNDWRDLGPRIAAGVLCAVGLLLLFLGLKRGKPATLPLRPGAEAVETYTTRKSLQSVLRATVTDTAGITAAKVKVKRRTAKVRAISPLPAEAAAVPDVDERLRERLTDHLDRIGLAHPLRLRIKVRAGAAR